MQVKAGTILEGKVSGIAAFGAFVELENGKTGLVHISEVSTEYVNDVKDHLKEGQEVKVKVLSTENDKISLSIKQVMLESREAAKERRKSGPKAKRRPVETGMRRPPEEFSFASTGEMSFDDMLQKFKQDSDEKFQDLKRSNESKRSGGYKRSY